MSRMQPGNGSTPDQLPPAGPDVGKPAKPRAFQAIQYQFTAHLRDPEHAPAPADVEDRRMAIYRDLLYRNVQGLIAGAFPVLRRIHDDARWHALVRDYFKDHQAHTPFFPKVSQEFLRYLQQERAAPTDYPFLSELAHYEWVEAALQLDGREIQTSGIERQGDLLAGTPALNPLTWLLQYRYPVHRIGPDYLPARPPERPTWLAVYRDRRDEVGFLELSPVTARLLDILSNTAANAGAKSTGRAILQRIAAELNHPTPQVVIDGGRQALQALRDKDIVLGVRAAT